MIQTKPIHPHPNKVQDMDFLATRLKMNILDELNKKLMDDLNRKQESIKEIESKIEKLQNIRKEIKSNHYLQKIINSLGETEEKLMKFRLREQGDYRRYIIYKDQIYDLEERKRMLLDLIYL